MSIHALLRLAFLAAATTLAAPPRSVQRAYTDSTNQVHVVYSDNQDIQIQSETDQVSIDSLQISPDRQTVGWLVNTTNCCTSYPVATILVLYRNGKITQRLADGLMLYQWKFVSGRNRVALSSGTVHGMRTAHLTLYDLTTGKLLQTWDSQGKNAAPRWGTSLIQ